jgi:hypothetical protein
MTNTLYANIATDTMRAILVDARAKRDHVVVRLVQDELHYRQPIVTAPAYIGWTATRGDYDLDDLVGHGRTEAEAVDDLLEREADLRADEPQSEPVDCGMAEERRKYP